MKTRVRIVDDNLSRVDLGWRWLRLLQHTGTLGVVLALFFVGLAVAMASGWVSDLSMARALVALVCALGLVSWCGLALGIFGKTLSPEWLARMVERGQPKLLDRVNTLVALEKNRHTQEVAPFYERIGRQARNLLIREPPAGVLSARRALLHLLALFLAVVATIRVYDKLEPWERLDARAKPQAGAAAPAAPEPTLELPPPENVVEQNPPWVEVRITDPGRDLEVTKVDVVPMQIEAAANEPLRTIGWISAVNGSTEQPHPLPAPSDPRYAVYQPVLYLDELDLADWDVLSYYAKAGTRASNNAASEVYFVHVRPFREDILKMPGGESGLAMQCINQLSSLIRQQEHVIRQTHQHRQNPPDNPKLQDQDRRKLAAVESDLSRATAHLYAQMAADLETKPISDALDHLAKAETNLDQAGHSLQDGSLDEAQSRERAALADLAGARKAFHKAVSEHPQDFAESPASEEPPPTAAPQEALRQIAEFRDEGKAARDLVENLQRQQQALASRIRTNAVPNFSSLAAPERQIQRTLQEFMDQHPRVFRPVQAQAESARQSLESAAQLLEKRNPKARPQVQEAAREMERLAQAMRDKDREQQLADAYKLKQMLERQIAHFGQCQNAGPSDQPSDAEMQKTVGETRQTLKELKALAEEPPTSDQFGPALRESLSDLKMLSLHWSLSDLEKNQPLEARQKTAGLVKESLEEISQAFEQSQPDALRAARETAPAGDPRAGWERGLAELDNLILQLRRDRPPAPEAQLKQGREALHHLQSAWNGENTGQGSPEPALARLAEALRPGENSLDLELLEELRNALQASAAEPAGPADRTQADQPDVTAPDPSRLPPAYRGRIEEYFRKLSEK